METPSTVHLEGHVAARRALLAAPPSSRSARLLAAKDVRSRAGQGRVVSPIHPPLLGHPPSSPASSHTFHPRSHPRPFPSFPEIPPRIPPSLPASPSLPRPLSRVTARRPPAPLMPPITMPTPAPPPSNPSPSIRFFLLTTAPLKPTYTSPIFPPRTPSASQVQTHLPHPLPSPRLTDLSLRTCPLFPLYPHVTSLILRLTPPTPPPSHPPIHQPVPHLRPPPLAPNSPPSLFRIPTPHLTSPQFPLNLLDRPLLLPPHPPLPLPHPQSSAQTPVHSPPPPPLAVPPPVTFCISAARIHQSPLQLSRGGTLIDVILRAARALGYTAERSPSAPSRPAGRPRA
jgi:hypothetical protein